MMNMEEVRSQLKNMLSQQRFSEAIAFLHEIEKQRELTPAELVSMAHCNQLAPDEGEWDLKDSEKAFKKALSIEHDYLPALIELGFFYYAVEDDPARALPFFQQAIEISRLHLTEASMGMAGCIEELQSQESASKFLGELHCGALVEDKLDEEKREWLQQGIEVIREERSK